MKSISRFLIIIMVAVSSGSAFASGCEANYTSSGSVFKGKSYTTFADFTVEPQVALQRLASQLAAEDFTIERTDEATQTIFALAKISSTRTAPVALRAEAIGGGTRIHFSITLPAGAVGNSTTKAHVCRFLEGVRIDPGSRYQHSLVKFVSSNAANKALVGVVESNAGKRAAKVALGVLGGALLGAAHAHLTGGDIGKEAAVGALAGGAVTFAITKIQDRRLANRDEVMLAQSYDATQGYRAGVRSVSVSPATVKPGEKITIVTTYWALAPVADETFRVSRYAGIALTGDFLRGFRFSPDPFQFGQGGGEYQTTIELEVPAATDPGTYSLHWVVDGQSTGGEDAATFKVAG